MTMPPTQSVTISWALRVASSSPDGKAARKTPDMFYASMRPKIRVLARWRWGDGMVSREVHWGSDGTETQHGSEDHRALAA
jgi:hypothetical protein